MSVHTSYILCTNPRSGSWLLSEGLASTGVAGNPREWFHHEEESYQCGQWGVECSASSGYSSYLAEVLKHGATPNGILGVKLHYYQFAELPKKLATIEECQGLPIAEAIRRALPGTRYLWLLRRDKVRQAISYYRACKTDNWWSIDGKAPYKRNGTVEQATYDPQAISEFEETVARNDSSWESYFRNNGISPLTVHYEDLAEDYRHEILRILRWLDVPSAETISIAAPRVRRQSDSQTEEWLTLYSKVKAEGSKSMVSPAVPSRPMNGNEAGDNSAAINPGPTPQPSVDIPDRWKRWIGENKLLKIPDVSIIQEMTQHGFSHEVASAEVAKAGSDPYLQAGENCQQRLNKASSLMNAFYKLSNLRSDASAVERRSNVSRQEFLERYYAANKPVVLQGLLENWRALTQWTPEYLKRTTGNEQVEIMVGREGDPEYEWNGHRHRRMIRFADYVDMVYEGNSTNDYYLVANNAFFQRPGTASLFADFSAFPEYLNPATTSRQCFLWFGPAGTVTPLHHDTSNLFMAQVAGRKEIKLISAFQLACVYNDFGVFSRVDCDRPDLNRWPKFADASVLKIVLEPGEVLFLPVGWWHQVRALDVSITISFTNFLFPNSYEWFSPAIKK